MNKILMITVIFLVSFVVFVTNNDKAQPQPTISNLDTISNQTSEDRWSVEHKDNHQSELLVTDSQQEKVTSDKGDKPKRESHELYWLNEMYHEELIKLKERYGDKFKFNDIYWIEYLGEENGQPVFNIIDLTLFTEEAFAASLSAFYFSIEQLEATNEFGEYNQETEESFRNYLDSTEGIKTEYLSCKKHKCMAEVSFNNITNKELDRISNITPKVMVNPEEYKCSTSRFINSDAKYLLTVTCKPEVENN